MAALPSLPAVARFVNGDRAQSVAQLCGGSRAVPVFPLACVTCLPALCVASRSPVPWMCSRRLRLALSINLPTLPEDDPSVHCIVDRAWSGSRLTDSLARNSYMIIE